MISSVDLVPFAPALVWRGPGVTAFVGRTGPEAPPPPAGGDGAPGFPPAAGAEAADACPPLFRLERGEGLADATGAPGASELSSAVEEFFAAGGRECLVAARGGTRSGEGGIDWRGAVNLLAETEETGTIVLLGSSAQGARDRALQLADRRPDLYFILEGRGGERAGSTSPPRTFEGGGPPEADPAADGPVILYLRENVALVRPGRESRPGLAAVLGGLAGFLEATDFTFEPRFRAPSPPRAPEWLPEPDRRFLAWWRRREGLRRSLDLGTRWTFLEPDGPLLRLRVEREVTAFLRRLEGHGLLEGAGSERAFDVECAPGAASAAAAGGPGRLALRVRASVRAPPPAARREPVAPR